MALLRWVYLLVIIKNKLFMSIQVGQKAPDFVLYDTDKNKYRLAIKKEKM